MSIRRNGRYTTVPTSVIEDARLGWAARGFLIYLLSKPDNWAGGISGVERELGRCLTADERNEINLCLQELRAAGYATFEPTFDQTGRLDRGIWAICEIQPMQEAQQ